VRPIHCSRFRWECLTNRAVSRFPPPATSHVACGFPALRAPAHFASRLMGPIPPERLPRPMADTILGTPKRVPCTVEPFPAPPLPAQAWTLARSGQRTPHLRFYPVSARLPIHQDHQILGEPCLFDCRPPLLPDPCFRPFQPPVCLMEVQIPEPRRNHPAWRNSLLPRRLP